MPGKKGRSVEERFWERVNKTDTCWLWTGAKNSFTGQGMMTVGPRGKVKCHIAYRLSWQFHYGPIPDGMCVLHTCDVRACVNPAHLFLGTQRDNMRDMMAKGRRGKTGPSGKLPQHQIRTMYAECCAGASRASVARKYGVSFPTLRYHMDRMAKLDAVT